MEDMWKYFLELERAGYITENGTPLKCIYCDSKELVDVNIMKSNYGIEEYEVKCNSCKKITGRWGYGNWTLF